MNKPHLPFLSLAALLCMLLIGTVSCHKDNDGDGTINPADAEFFVDVNFIPETETNGEVAPRLIANFNDEAVMIEMRSGADTVMEAVLFLCPDHEAFMMCGDKSQMVCAAYDVKTNTPSDDVLLVTPVNDGELLLTKCVMDWSTKTMTKGEMMVLHGEEGTKQLGGRGDINSETRAFFFNHFVKPLSEAFDKAAGFCNVFGGHGGTVLSLFGTTITTGLTINLYGDDPEALLDHSEFTITKWVGDKIKSGLLSVVPANVKEAASLIFTAWEWHSDGGHGKFNSYSGNNNGSNSNHQDEYHFVHPAFDMNYAAYEVGVPPTLFHLGVNVSNITETTVNLKGRFQFGGSSITPVEMGYVIGIDGGPGYIIEDMDFKGITVTDLEKATKYIVYAYAKTLFDTIPVTSDRVTFWTLGFEAFPTSLEFPYSGDTKYVGLSYSHEDITGWDITSSPSWCSITIDDLGLLAVTVGETTEERSGTITVTGQSMALGSVTTNITVTQQGKGFFTGTPFDSTRWSVSGTYNETTTGTKRVESEFHYVPNGNSYYTYRIDNFSETDNGNFGAIPSFINNTFYYLRYDGNELLYEFKGDSIIMKLVLNGAVIGTIGLVNGNTLTTGNNKKITASRYFKNNNTFCFKTKEETTYDFSGSNYGHKYITLTEILITYTITESTNNCIVDVNKTYTLNTLEHGIDFTGRLSENSTYTAHAVGTWEHGSKNETTTKRNQEEDLLLPDFLRFLELSNNSNR